MISRRQRSEFGQFATERCRSVGAESGCSRERIIFSDEDIRASSTVGACLFAFHQDRLLCAVPGLVFLGGCDPAYPLIACWWRDARAYICDNWVRLNRLSKSYRHSVDCAGSDRLSGHGFQQCAKHYPFRKLGAAPPVSTGFPVPPGPEGGCLDVRFSRCRPPLTCRAE